MEAAVGETQQMVPRRPAAVLVPRGSESAIVITLRKGMEGCRSPEDVKNKRETDLLWQQVVVGKEHETEWAQFRSILAAKEHLVVIAIIVKDSKEIQLLHSVAQFGQGPAQNSWASWATARRTNSRRRFAFKRRRLSSGGRLTP